MADLSLEGLLSRPPYRVDGLVVRKNGKAVGLLHPASLHGFDAQRRVVIQGLRGTVTATDHTLESVLAAVLAAGALLIGDEDEVASCAALLVEPVASRTFAYLCCLVEDCAQALSAHERLSRSSVTFLGCGGIGSLAALCLAGAGVRDIRLVDADLVEKSNLNRQFFFAAADIGRAKVEVIKEVILERFSNVVVTCHAQTITSENMVPLCTNTDAILLTADHPISLPAHVRKYAMSAGKFLVHAGYGINHGLVRVSKVAGDEEIAWSRPPNSVMPSSGPINLELAGVASNILMQHIALLPERAELATGWVRHRYPREIIHRR